MTRSFSDALLAWFDSCARLLPWRVAAACGCRRDPYSVTVSEIMLQQTQVATVIPYYHRFMARFPDFEALAAADETEVLKYWEGLGYYRRAKNLHALAKRVVDAFDGHLPGDKKQLLSLPGIGPYTAGAILSFAYDLAEPAVDGNVVRVMARLDALPHVKGDPKGQGAVRKRVAGLLPPERTGDFSEALIELGATVCLPASPACPSCPVRSHCRAFSISRVEDYPVGRKERVRPVTRLTYLLVHDRRFVCVRRRPEGLLAGLYEFLALPGKLEQEKQVREQLEAWMSGTAFELNFRGERRAIFSHRVWEMAFWEVEAISPGSFTGRDTPQNDGRQELIQVALDELSDLPFPAFLVAWRDAFVGRYHWSQKNPGPI